MVIRWQCILPSLVLCFTLCFALPTISQDEPRETLVKRSSPEQSYDAAMLRYFLTAMANSRTPQQPTQLLNRGVRRLGSEFLGKRSASVHEEKNNQSCQDCLLDDAEGLEKEHLSYTGQYDYNEPDTGEATSNYDLDTYSPPEKRNLRRYNPNTNGNGLRNFLSLLMSKKMGSEFLGKRMGSEFLGKRAMGSEFLGKRALGSEFLGKRTMGSEFLGKRAMGSEFLGKRAMGSEFLGKRGMGSEFLGKRAMGSEFLGKRAMGSEFLGKRAMGSEFLGKRAMGSEFLGKRGMGSEFLGKRNDDVDFIPVSETNKRALGSEFLG